jgi:hypothetical protein
MKVNVLPFAAFLFPHTGFGKLSRTESFGFAIVDLRIQTIVQICKQRTTLAGKICSYLVDSDISNNGDRVGAHQANAGRAEGSLFDLGGVAVIEIKAMKRKALNERTRCLGFKTRQCRIAQSSEE